MEDENVLLPYSELWLRKRGARFHPLKGGEIPSQVETIGGPDQPSKGIVQPPVRKNGDEGKPSQRTDEDSEQPFKGIVQPPIRRNGDNEVDLSQGTDRTPGGGTSDQTRPKRQRHSRWSLVMGILLALAAVFAAEHYLVLWFHSMKTASYHAKGQGKMAAVTTIPSPRPAPTIPPAKTTVIPKRASSVPSVETARPPSTISASPPAAVPMQPQLEAPRQAAVVPVPAMPIARETPPAPSHYGHGVAASAAPSPRYKESKAQYELQHLHQLLSPFN